MATVKIKRVSVSPATLRSRLDDFERRYSVKSEHLATAFRDDRGDLVETADFHRWCRLYSAWELATHR
jgi:hypothetical protein